MIKYLGCREIGRFDQNGHMLSAVMCWISSAVDSKNETMLCPFKIILNLHENIKKFLVYFFYYRTKPFSTPGHFILKVGVNPF